MRFDCLHYVFKWTLFSSVFTWGWKVFKTDQTQLKHDRGKGGYFVTVREKTPVNTLFHEKRCFVNLNDSMSFAIEIEKIPDSITVTKQLPPPPPILTEKVWTKDGGGGCLWSLRLTKHHNSRNSEDKGGGGGVFCHPEWENTFLHEKRCFVNLNDQRSPPPSVFSPNLFCQDWGGGGSFVTWIEIGDAETSVYVSVPFSLNECNTK